MTDYREHYELAVAERKQLASRLDRAYSVMETAVCLWEAVCEMERAGDSVADDETTEVRGDDIRTSRDAIGTAALRSAVIGWADSAEAAWKAADTDNGAYPDGGQYPDSFDWEFIPAWISANVDWSNPRHPTINR